MTARVGTMSVDGTPISPADLARIEADEELHAEQQRAAVRVVAACAGDVDDCRLLLSILGLEGMVSEARAEMRKTPPATPKRSRKRRAA